MITASLTGYAIHALDLIHQFTSTCKLQTHWGKTIDIDAAISCPYQMGVHKTALDCT